MPDMDPLFQAMSLFHRRQFELCVQVTSSLLEKNPNDQVIHYICICVLYPFVVCRESAKVLMKKKKII